MSRLAGSCARRAMMNCCADGRCVTSMLRQKGWGRRGVGGEGRREKGGGKKDRKKEGASMMDGFEGFPARTRANITISLEGNNQIREQEFQPVLLPSLSLLPCLPSSLLSILLPPINLHSSVRPSVPHPSPPIPHPSPTSPYRSLHRCFSISARSPGPKSAARRPVTIARYSSTD